MLEFDFVLILLLDMSQDSLVGIGTDCTIGVRFPAVSGNFSLRHHVQTGSGAYLDSYAMGTGGSFPGDKAAGA
jgi:hypothetical protein